MTVLEIVEKYLRDNGYDGLYLPGECACKIGDLAPCGEINEDCRAGVIIDSENMGVGEDRFIIGEREVKENGR